jgi:hypothetical protein
MNAEPNDEVEAEVDVEELISDEDLDNVDGGSFFGTDGYAGNGGNGGNGGAAPTFIYPT